MQFWNTAIDSFAKGHLGAHSGLWWNRKYLQIKSGEKLSKELPCDVRIPLTVLYLSFYTALGKLFWRKWYKGIFGSILTPMVKREIASDKNWKEAFYETAQWYVYSCHINKAFFTLHNLETLSWTDLWRDIREHIRAYGEKANIFR